MPEFIEKRVLLALSGLLIMLSIPMALGLISPNPLYGFRTAETLANAETWYAANRFAGWALLTSSFASGVILWFLPPGTGNKVLRAVFLVALGLAVAASVGYLKVIT